MTNSKYKIGDFYFKQAEEPTRVDIKTVRKSRDFGYFMSPYNLIQDQGHSPTSIVLQGFLGGATNFLEGSAGDYGFEKLKGEMSKVGEKIIEIENFDSTNNVRRYYGLPLDIKYTMVGNRPAIYDYLLSFICPNPFAYDDTLQYTTGFDIGVADTPFTLTGKTDGSVPTHPVFIFENNDGSTSITQLKISDHNTSTSSGNVITITGTLLAGDSWVIFPTKYDNVHRVYSINTVYTYDGVNLDASVDQYTALDVSDTTITVSSTASGKYPTVTQNAEVMTAKATGHANGDLFVQYRPNWG